MACAILILLWVQDEWGFDRHFENADNLYRVIQLQHHSNGESTAMVPTPGPLAAALKKEYPEICRASRLMVCPLTLKKGNEFIEEMVTSVDKDFLKMFTLEFVRGDIHSALNDPHSIILTEESARKYFGNVDALGKTIESRGYVVTVTGVIKSLPRNSHFQFDFLVPIDWLLEFGGPINNWDSGCDTYVELANTADCKIVDSKIANFIKKNKKGSNSEIFLQNIQKIHLYSSKKYAYDTSNRGDIVYVRMMGLIAIFILLIACINFMNLSTAQSTKRAKEIGIRKVTGAQKRRIVVQFLGESFIIVFVAHIIAMVLVELFLPGYNNLIGKQLTVNYQSATYTLAYCQLFYFAVF
jgi:ABC-type antimicrobial peptide transport system permease subunit